MKFRLLGGLALALFSTLAYPASLVVLPQQLVVDGGGEPRSGARLYIYDAGTTTPRTTYTTNSLSAANANPVVAVSTGLFPAIYVNPAEGPYKLVLKTSADVTIWTEDNIPAGEVTLYPVIPAEAAAAVTVDNTAYAPLDIRRYGAVCDYDSGSETDGAPATSATDNLDAFDDAIDVATELGGGVIRVQGGGECYVSNSIDARGVSNLYVYVEPGTTIRSTRYTSSGGLLIMGHTGPVGSGVTNVGVYGGGTLRTFQPDHATIANHQTSHAYALGDYVLSTDTNGETRAYYCKTAGTSGSSSPPDVINGSDTDGTVVWQDADNDNVIGISADGVRVEGMDIPAAAGKPITVQTPNWKNVWILNNRIGQTNDKAIEVKGNQGSTGQEAALGDGVTIQGNVVASAGYEGIEVEQSSFSSALNENCRVIGNIIRSAGVVDTDASGIRINRCDGVEVRGNRVLDSGGNGYHLRLSKNVVGDLYTESAGVFGVHLQELDGFSFDYIYVKSSGDSAVKEADDNFGGFVGRLLVDTATDGWETTSRDGVPPVIASYSMSGLSGSEFVGDLPSILPQAPAAKLQYFTLTVTNDGGTLKHAFYDDVLNASASSYVDRLTSATSTLTATPTATNSSTAFANGGKVSSTATSEFILDTKNAVSAAIGVKLCSIVQNDTGTPALVGVSRRSVDVNGATLLRPHIQLRQQSDGAALAWSTGTIGSGKTISVSCVMFLP